ncbi:hypothetical protein [Nodosilinea sp. P-1105]|uniref:hypothetical protein n=1 Tax=Nodosilinea sp. P-1105 TaxID=2546229 RepID=UPI00146AB18A|nr:hypothetical protein [Nodosilinea sp. P-1105]NMF84595.1 hypothetical protein [Nodosilinea sp. P-1105]
MAHQPKARQSKARQSKTQQHRRLTTSLLLGSLGLVGVAFLNPAQAETIIGQRLGQGDRQALNAQAGPGCSRGLGTLLGQGRGQGRGPGQAQGRGPGQSQGRGQRGAHLAEAAAQLGVTEDALRSALGIPAERPQRPDLATAAAQLGTTETELRDSLCNAIREHRESRQPGTPGSPPNFTTLAQQYGVSEAEFRQIMGIPNRPDLAAAAAQLGVTEEALREALQSTHRGRGPGSGPNRGPGRGLGR